MTFDCEKCEMPVAEYKNGEILIFCHAENDGKRINLKEILAAAARSADGLMILRKFYDRNETVNFIVK